MRRCAFGPTGPCGGMLASRIVPKADRNRRSAAMFSGTLFGGFVGHAFSSVTISHVSHDGSFFALSAAGFVWAATWTAMVHAAPYRHADDASRHSMRLGTTPWKLIFRAGPFVSLLIASVGYVTSGVAHR